MTYFLTSNTFGYDGWKKFYSLEEAAKEATEDSIIIPNLSVGGFLEVVSDLKNGIGRAHYRVNNGVVVKYKNPTYICRLKSDKNDKILFKTKCLESFRKLHSEITKCNFLLETTNIECNAKFYFVSKYEVE